MSVVIEIYNLAGRKVETFNVPTPDDGVYSGEDVNALIRRLANGVYIYRIVITSSSGGRTVKTGKLAVLK